MVSKKDEKETSNPFAIFHSVAIVGFDSPLSICPSISLLTPVFLLAVSRFHPWVFLNAFKVIDMVWLRLFILSKNAATIQRTLTDFNLSCQVREIPNSTRTAADAAASIGCQIGQIAKSLVFKEKCSGKLVLVLVSGTNRVNEKRIKENLGSAISKADARFVKDVTGFSIGGIPPVGHKQKINVVYIDESLMAFENIWAAAGTPNAVFCIKTSDLLTITGGKVISVV